MKSNSFLSKFKYFMLIPAFLALVAIVFSVIFGFNLDYDFKNVNTFDIKLGTTVTAEEYNLLEDGIVDMVEEVGIEDYRIERIGEHASNGFVVKIVNENNNIDTKLIDELKTNIESNLHNEYLEDIESPLMITTGDTGTNLPMNFTSMLLYSILAIGLVMLFVFFYNFIRFNLIAGVTGVLNILFSIAILTAILLTARIPVNYYVMIAYFVMTVLSVLFTAFVNNSIKSTLRQDKFAKYSNEERVLYATKSNLKNILFISVAIIIGLLGIMFFGNLSLIYTSIAIIVGVLVSIFATTIFGNSLWAFWYKKDKDLVLKRRLEIEKKKLEEKDKNNDKIVV